MPALLHAALILAALSTCAPAEAARRRGRTACVPVLIEGVGTVQICGTPFRRT